MESLKKLLALAAAAEAAFGLVLLAGPPLVGMLIYSAVVTLYLAYVGFP